MNVIGPQRRTVGRPDRSRPALGACERTAAAPLLGQAARRTAGDRAAGAAGERNRRRPAGSVKLQIGARLVETLVGATLGEGDIGGLVHSPIAVASIGYAQRLAGRADGSPGSSCATTRRARAQVRAALAAARRTWNVNLEPGTFDSRLFAVAVAPESKSEELFSGISALVGFMFALNAMLITVPSRRKLIEDMRPHGATRWMTVQILLFDAP